MGARSIDVEIYDECTFSPDALIAHTSVPVTDSLLTKGEMVDDWWPLSGQEGEEKEGLLHLILSLQVRNPFCIILAMHPGEEAYLANIVGNLYAPLFGSSVVD